MFISVISILKEVRGSPAAGIVDKRVTRGIKNVWSNLWVCACGLLRRAVIVVGLFTLWPGSLQAEGENGAERGWSQDLLSRLLALPQDERSVAERPGMILRSYQLRTLQLGQPGRPTHLVNILNRMLPPESRVTEEPKNNVLHVLTSESAHLAVVDLLAAMDAAEKPTIAAAAAFPDEVRHALEALATSHPDRELLLKAIRDSAAATDSKLAAEVGATLQRGTAEMQRTFFRWGVVGLGVVLGGGVLALLWVGFAQRRLMAKTEIAGSASQALAARVPSMDQLLAASDSEQRRMAALQQTLESLSIAFQANQQRTSQAIELVARKEGDISAALAGLDQLRRDIGEAAGDAFLEINRTAVEKIIERAAETLHSRMAVVGEIAEVATRKLDATANRLEVQNERVGKLAAELERTQKELDALYSRLEQARSQATAAELEATRQRELAYEKAAELSRREAALASLSLLLQESEASILSTLDDNQDHVLDDATLDGPEVISFDDATSRPVDLTRSSAAVGSDLEIPCPTNSPHYKILPIS